MYLKKHLKMKKFRLLLGSKTVRKYKRLKCNAVLRLSLLIVVRAAPETNLFHCFVDMLPSTKQLETFNGTITNFY